MDSIVYMHHFDQTYMSHCLTERSMLYLKSCLSHFGQNTKPPKCFPAVICSKYTVQEKLLKASISCQSPYVSSCI